MDKINEIIKRGLESDDPNVLKAIMKLAAKQAEKGNYCECVKAKTYESDLLCGECYLVDRRQVKFLPQYRSGWHTPVPDKNFPNLCQICIRNIKHAVHYRGE